MNLESETTGATSKILMKVSGKDGPGVFSELTEVLAKEGVKILDMSQAVIHQLLSLTLLFEIGTESGILESIKTALFKKARVLGVKLELDPINADSLSPIHLTRNIKHYALTLLADPVSAPALHEVSKILAKFQVNINFVKKLSEESFTCIEMGISSPNVLDVPELRKNLLTISKNHPVDVALQAEGLFRRAKRLVVLDMDSTLIQSEVIDELAREKGVFDQVSAITHQAMLGKMNFTESLRLRCQTLKGLQGPDLEKVYQRIQLMPGAENLIQILKKLGYKIAVISGGFTFVAERLKQRLGLDYAYANNLILKDGILTGEVLPPIIDAQRKADLLDVIAQQEKIVLDQVIAVGDGANDLLMLEKAGLGIAFNAKPVVREKADLAINQKNMKSILYLLGLSEREVSELL